MRILEENDNFKRKKIYGKEIVKHISESLQIGERRIYYAIQFARKYPNLEKFLNKAEEGKNLSMTKVIRKYLPEPQKEKEERLKRCKHLELRCIECGKVIKKSKLCLKK